MIARFFAALIVVLAVSPFTAPFTILDGAEMVVDHKVQADATGAKVVQDVVDMGVLPPSLLPAHSDSQLTTRWLDNRLVARPVLALVLRI